MRLRTLAVVGAGLASTVAAFQDTSPFAAILPVSVPIDSSFTKRFASSSKISDLTQSITNLCPSPAYVIVSQPGLHSDDHGNNQPHLTRRSASSQEVNSVFVPEVIGQVDANDIARKIQTICGGSLTRVNGSEGRAPSWEGEKHIVRLEFSGLPKNSEERKKALLKNDATLNAVLTSLEHLGSTSVLFTSSQAVPHSDEGSRGVSGHAKSHLSHSTHNQHPMQVDFDDEHASEEPVHVAWKRDVDGHMPASWRRQETTNGTNANAGLFERYNFLTPGIFMGGLALLLLFSILLVGMTAVASIEVSLGSFNKEMVQVMTKAQKQQ